MDQHRLKQMQFVRTAFAFETNSFAVKTNCWPAAASMHCTSTLEVVSHRFNTLVVAPGLLEQFTLRESHGMSYWLHEHSQ
jgi:hypothetical protein